MISLHPEQKTQHRHCIHKFIASCILWFGVGWDRRDQKRSQVYMKGHYVTNSEDA